MTQHSQSRSLIMRLTDQTHFCMSPHCCGTFQPRVLLALLLALIALTHTAIAQDTSKIPTLQLWFEAKGIGKVNYLPNFDVAGGGANAIAVNKNCGETWYLGNGTVDTTNRFCWGRGLWVTQVDFNGDGVSDYIDDNRNVFEGTSKNTPPKKDFVATYKDFQMPVPGRQNRYFIDDFTGDGKQDVLVPGLYNLGKVLIGNSDITKMNVVEFPSIPNTAYSLQYVVGAWRGADGTNRMVVYQQTDTTFFLRTEAFFLYSFRIEGDKVTYTTLDTTEFKDFKDKYTPSYRYSSSFVWHSQDGNHHTLVLGFDGQTERLTDVYRITNTRLEYVLSKKKREGGDYIIKYGIINKNNTGYIRGYNPFMFVYEGNPTEDTVAKAWIYSGIESITSIGDVNNDGYGDIAVQRGETVSFYLGRGISTDIVNGDVPNNSLILNNNQPCSRSGILVISLNIHSIVDEIHCSLFTLQGRLVADLGVYPTTGGVISIPLSRYSISPGMYNLRCIVAGKVVDKGLIITE